MTPIQKAKEIITSFWLYQHNSNMVHFNPDGLFENWLATPEAAALLSGEDWKEDGMPLLELIEETWDKHSQLIGSDIDDLQYWAGRDVMKAIDF